MHIFVEIFTNCFFCVFLLLIGHFRPCSTAHAVYCRQIVVSRATCSWRWDQTFPPLIQDCFILFKTWENKLINSCWYIFYLHGEKWRKEWQACLTKGRQSFWFSPIILIGKLLKLFCGGFVIFVVDKSMDKSNLVFENSVGLIRCQFCESLIQIHWFIVINMQHFLTTCASDQTGIRMQASPSPKKILPQTLRQNF